jgi:Fur family transcriptional regulator, ferric uptake regulator
MQTSAEHLHDALRASGMRLTLARRVICRILADADEEHLSAAEILERANGVAGGVDQSTVYRTLEALADLGYVQHVHIGHGPGFYHLSGENAHHHLVCERCDAAINIPQDDLGPAFASVREKYGFMPDSTHFAILGHCRKCLEAASS